MTDAQLEKLIAGLIAGAQIIKTGTAHTHSAHEWAREIMEYDPVKAAKEKVDTGF